MNMEEQIQAAIRRVDREMEEEKNKMFGFSVPPDNPDFIMEALQHYERLQELKILKAEMIAQSIERK